MKVHGIEVYGLPLKQHKLTPCRLGHKEQKKPAEPAAPTLPSATAGDAPPKPLTKRQQRSAQRLMEFQEQKRAAAVQELVAKGCELSVAQAKVARLERKRLRGAREGRRGADGGGRRLRRWPPRRRRWAAAR